MSLNESIIEDAALKWFKEMGYATFHRPQETLSEAISVRDIFAEVG